jgi:hypothetical protein
VDEDRAGEEARNKEKEEEEERVSCISSTAQSGSTEE